MNEKPALLSDLVMSLSIALRLSPEIVWRIPFAEALRLSRAYDLRAPATGRRALESLMTRFPDSAGRKNEHAR
jgi:uncharacterized phage protein (TIGR02216 family)